MSDSMTERVARAIWRERYEVGRQIPPPFPTDRFDLARELAIARAAIEAMRIKDVVYYVDGRPNASPQDIDWNRRIDAALKEPA